MKATLASLAVLILLTVPGHEAHAQVAKKTIDVLPGGKTIGGPGVARWTNSTRTVFAYASGLSLCATASNVSKGSASMTLSNTVAQQVTVALDEGNTQTACLNSVDSVELVCGSTTECKVLWRLDTIF